MSSQTLTGDASLGLPEFEAPPADPLPLAAAWLQAAIDHPILEAAAATLATADAAGRVSSRTVAVKQIDARGAVFGTSLAGRKAADLAANPHASLAFYWRGTIQQLLLNGPVERLDDAEADAVWADRARAAQAASLAAVSGETLDDEGGLADRYAEIAAGPGPLLRPAGWGAFRLLPEELEFWHGRATRLHRRLRYRREGERWVAERLQP